MQAIARKGYNKRRRTKKPTINNSMEFLRSFISRGNQWWRYEMSSVSQAKSNPVDTENEEAKKSGHINGVFV